MTRPHSNPTTSPQWAREVDKRLRAAETKGTAKIGSWTLMEDPGSGMPVLVRPGQTLDAGTTAAEVVDLGALRGFVTEDQVANALSDNTTSDLTVVTDLLEGRWGEIADAQTGADTANTGVLRIESLLADSDPGSTGVIDEFDRPEGPIGADYVHTESGGGSERYTTNGSGLLVWKASGGNGKDTTDRHVTATSTALQYVSAVMASVPARSGSLSQDHSQLRLCGRCSDDNATRVEARVKGDNDVEIGYRIAGTYTRIGPNIEVAEDFAVGDRWDLWLGVGLTGDDPWTYILRRNQNTVHSVIDSAHLLPLNPAQQYAAIAAHAGTTVAFYITKQIAAPSLRSFAFGDRTP